MRAGLPGRGLGARREGLNVQVYNRCIGTRFCEANCPYKVRRFNWFAYAGAQAYGGIAPALEAQHNPDVSARGRGVMEKCNYCLQRISRARRTAEKEDRQIAEGEMVTACQAACPTRAIHFGDLNDQTSDVSRLRKATTGDFHLFCAEFCGTQHSHMTGDIVVMTQSDYTHWLGSQPHGDDLVREGETLFANFGCGACHAPQSQVRAPKLAGLYGSLVTLAGGRQVTAGDAYLSNAILHPRDGAVAGYPPIMPDYAGVAKPAEVDALIAYLKSLSSQRANP